MNAEQLTGMQNAATEALDTAIRHGDASGALGFLDLCLKLAVVSIDPVKAPKPVRCDDRIHIATVGAAVCECGAKTYGPEKVAKHMRTADESSLRAHIAPTPVPEGMPIQAPKPAAPCMHSVYQKGTCLLPWGHNTDHDFDGERMANVPSTKAMLCDGPAPTPAQVARIRNTALEDAATDLEALKLIGAHDCARVLRNLKTPESK